MGFIQIEKIGLDTVFNCSILKEEHVSTAFYSSASNPIYWNDKINNITGGTELFSKLGDNCFQHYYANDGTTYHIKTEGSGVNQRLFYIVPIATIQKSSVVNGDVDGISIQFCPMIGTGKDTWIQFFVTNRKFTNAPTKIATISNTQFSGYVPPSYNAQDKLSIIIDTELKELNIFVLYSYGWEQKRGHCILNTSDERKRAYELLAEYIDMPSTDPWRNSGYADIGGGECELDLSSDIISLPNLPISAASTGFIQLYAPSFRQINELSDYMWGDGFVNNVLKLWNDPMDIIINLAQFPINIPVAGTQRVTAGNVVTTVEMDYPSNQYVELDCGSLEVKHFYNAYLDYEPYTSCKIFLPYVGTETLSMDDIMGKTVNVKYRIDLISGACVAFILCNNVLLYTFTGACSVNIPVSGQTFAGIANAVISTVTAGAVAKGAGVTSKGNPIPSSKPGAVASSLASNVMACKPVVERSGSISANMGLLGAQRPYLIFTVPRTCLPKNQNTYLGYPTFMSLKLSKVSGYTEIEEIRLDDIACTEDERDEIMLLLKEGVIL